MNKACNITQEYSSIFKTITFAFRVILINTEGKVTNQTYDLYIKNKIACLFLSSPPPILVRVLVVSIAAAVCTTQGLFSLLAGAP